MKPWFIREDNVVPFPKKDKAVVRLPNVNAYPDFLTGVQDLQNHLKNGDISSDIHKKLYQDLIQRFMRVESFETPWFIREAPAIDVDAETKKKLEQWFKKYAPYHTLEGRSMLELLITLIAFFDLDEESMDPLEDSCVYAPEFLNLLQRTNPDKDKTVLKKLWFERENKSWNAADVWKALKKRPTAGFLRQAMQGQYKEIDFNPPAKFLGNRQDAPITNACVDELMNILRINDLHHTKIGILSGMMELPHIQSILKTGTVSMSKAKQPVLNSKTYDITNTNVVQTESFETPWFLREAPGDPGITGLGVAQRPPITPNQGGISSLNPMGKDRAQKLNRIVNKLKADPEFIDQIFDQLSAKTKDVEGQFVNRFVQMLDPKLTNPEKDQTFGGFLKSFAEIIAETPGSNEEKFQFVNTLGKVSHIDISKLLQPTANWDSWLVGTPFSKKLFEQCFNDPRLRTNLKGPGEAALAILSPSIKLMTEAGDIEINKQKVEVKGGESSKGGRLTPTKNVVGQVDAAWIRKNIFNNNKKAVIPNNTSHLNFVELLVKPNNMSAEQINRLLSSIFLSPNLKKEIAKISKKTLNITSQDLFKLGLLNYSYSQNDDNFLILTRDVRKSIYFSINDWERAYQNIAISFAITGSDSRSTGIPQLGVKAKTI